MIVVDMVQATVLAGLCLFAGLCLGYIFGDRFGYERGVNSGRREAFSKARGLISHSGLKPDTRHLLDAQLRAVHRGHPPEAVAGWSDIEFHER